MQTNLRLRFAAVVLATFVSSGALAGPSAAEIQALRDDLNSAPYRPGPDFTERSPQEKTADSLRAAKKLLDALDVKYKLVPAFYQAWAAQRGFAPENQQAIEIVSDEGTPIADTLKSMKTALAQAQAAWTSKHPGKPPISVPEPHLIYDPLLLILTGADGLTVDFNLRFGHEVLGSAQFDPNKTLAHELVHYSLHVDSYFDRPQGYLGSINVTDANGKPKLFNENDGGLYGASWVVEEMLAYQTGGPVERGAKLTEATQSVLTLFAPELAAAPSTLPVRMLNGKWMIELKKNAGPDKLVTLRVPVQGAADLSDDATAAISDLAAKQLAALQKATQESLRFFRPAK